MAINELHSRLEYLVSYSSQLIFISCESLSQQQSSLQQFIAKQHENTEVAFINGDSKLRDSDYRNEIYRQLVSHPLSPSIPLDEQLIQQLPKETGPILLCICAAQHISNALLNELWSLVLKNKDLNKGHHLNVLLFGSPQWTESAKTNLAKDNQHLPILLSSETVAAHQFTENWTRSIHQNRAKVERQMNASDETESESIIRKPLFKIVTGLLFLSIFFMLVFWQYPDEINQFIDPQSTNVKVATKALEIQPLNESDDTNIFNQQNANEANSESAVNAEIIEQPESINEESEPQNEQPTNDQKLLSASTDNTQELVTSWKHEVEKQQALNQQKNEVSEQVKQDVEVKETLIASVGTENNEPQTAHPLTLLDDNVFVLQLASMSDASVATQYIKQHNLEDASWLYTTQRFGGDWHVVIFKKTFANAQQARQYTASLPDSIDNTVPFAKSVKQIKVELAVSQH